MTTPESVYDYDVNTREKVLLKQEEVLGGFEISQYATERTWAPAPDGQRIPISLVYRKTLRKPEVNPLLLYGYGSYGISMDADFRSPRLSLLDRGFVFAIAHVREGRNWVVTGMSQGNSFTRKTRLRILSPVPNTWCNKAMPQKSMCMPWAAAPAGCSWER